MSLPTAAVRSFALAALAVASLPALAAAGLPRSVDQKLPADPQGRIEISNVAGRIEVQGWDRAEIAVSGSLGADVERLEFTSAGGRAEVRVVLPRNGRYVDDGDADLVIRVPARSAVTASVVSADLVSRGVVGRQEIQTVSGDVEADVTGDARVSSVSGDVRLDATGSGRLELRTVSGNLAVGGAAGGEVQVNTVSGDARLAFGTLGRARFGSVSGNLTVDTALTPDARFEAESVSGDVTVRLVGKPAGEFDVETLSGEIDNCFGPKPVEPKYGPGSSLSFREGQGTASVRIETKSGNVELCRR
jgi:DUF4097 and DUF4098 domain-containing protein YvlB